VNLPDEFDTLLRQTLAVEPSAEFLPRVREHVAATPRRRFDLRWALVAGAGVAAVLMLTIWLAPSSEFDRPTSVPVVASAPSSPSGGTSPSPAAVETPPRLHVAAQASGGETRRTRMRQETTPRSEAPAVIVDERQQTAIASVMRLVAEGKLTAESFADTTPPSVDGIREQVLPLIVAPVQVSPFTVGGVLQKELNATEPPPAR